MDSIELVPFREMIHDSVWGIMIAHLFVPELDSTPNQASTLSPAIIKGLLRKDLGFTGFVVSDALDMKGVAQFYKPGEIELKSFMAGNDILLLPQNLDIAVSSFTTVADSILIPNLVLESHVKKILRLKYQLGLTHRRPVDTAGIYSDLFRSESEVIQREIYQEAITLVRDPFGLIPLRYLDRRRIASLAIGDSLVNKFQERLSSYATTDHYHLPASFTKREADSMVFTLNSYDVVILGLFSTQSKPDQRFGVTPELEALIDTLGKLHRTILVVLGTPYALHVLDQEQLPESVIVAYQNTEISQEKAAEGAFGGISMTGSLPVTVGEIPIQAGLHTDKCRLSFIIPEEMGIPREAFDGIDSLLLEGIAAGAYPGCQVLFAVNGKVIYYKAFGHPRYKDTTDVKISDLYDLASITKVAATTLAIMKLDDIGLMKPTDTLGAFLPELSQSNKSRLTIKDVMTHQAGLEPLIRFYEIPGITRDSIYRIISDSPLLPKKEYRYSDIGFYLLKEIIERLTQKKFDAYLEDQFYKPLGLQTMCFNPLLRFDSASIIPTEVDSLFRHQLVHGKVHDQGAWLLGGIAGHAGLFSNALDLAILFEMLLDGGNYGGKRYLSSHVIKEYTRAPYSEIGNRRGLGFDKPPLHATIDGPCCPEASSSSFGHSGFTGTYVWADPDNKLLYVFLSNRVYPSATNEKLSKMNIRTRVHQKMYDILKKYYFD
jgi:CubicO group peptidase (beta-lactamase class C family)